MKTRWGEYKSFFRDGLWEEKFAELSKFKQQLLKYVLALVKAMKTFNEHKIGFQCVALSYFWTMAIVPLFALVLGVLGKLGLEDILKERLYNTVTMQNGNVVVDKILEGAGNILSVAENGVFGVVCALSFMWLIVWAMVQVERVFNNVWNATASRKFWKRVVAVFVFMVFSPFVVLALFTAPVAYVKLENVLGVGSLVSYIGGSVFLKWFLLYIFVVLLFSVMYKFIPAAHVRYKYAFYSALISGFFFVLLQYVYLNTQMFINRWSHVLGGFALIPLFMVWLNFGWWVILVGSELCYGYQNIDEYIKEEI